MLGPTIRILSAYIDEVGWGIEGLMETQILAEGDRAERWVKPKAQILMERHGWRDDNDIFVALKLSPQRRRALELDIKGFTDLEIARDLGVTLNTVKIWLHRDRLKMRELREIQEIEVSA
jgi:DNA-binding NarL/FixJ family response regulator